MLAIARQLLAGLRARRRVAARLIGIGLTRLQAPAPTAQLTLLGAGPETVETDRDRAVAGAMDTITTRFGRDAVRPARLTRKRSNPQESGGPQYICSVSSYPDGYANHRAHAEGPERADC